MQYSLEYEIADGYTRPDNCRMNIPNIAERLDAAMKARKVKTQTRLADLSGVPQPTIARILKGGGRQGPETETLRPLATALHVHLRWLQEGLGPMEISDPVSDGPSPNERHGETAADARKAEQAVENILRHVVELVDTYHLADPAGRRRIDAVVQRVRGELSARDQGEVGTS
jgi:transcriptional regulator with XRE-family HTH domain